MSDLFGFTDLSLTLQGSFHFYKTCKYYSLRIIAYKVLSTRYRFLCADYLQQLFTWDPASWRVGFQLIIRFTLCCKYLYSGIKYLIACNS